ncbi:glycerate kinase [Euzebyella marina]|uniref:Glycerate kinase n=1 Tax=Euzebyella marina TaxID=1761453 RepID=A0A3G2L7I3_9FLAO|nr:glycerate kinase [Euzebyella marina]AYN68229.1 glycerate kinase [Euzebyella marina]
MKFVIAPDKYKDSLTGFEFCNCVEKGIRQVLNDAEIVKMPLADGGDGTIDVVQHYIKGSKVQLTVKDPLFRPITTSYLYSEEEKIAYIEMAEASGLKILAKNERNCMYTTTYGTGELILHALDKGAEEIILGIGGSATNDGGIGMATALGFKFLDSFGNELKPTGENLQHIYSIDKSFVHHRLNEVSVKVACDVTNPFYGENGAAYIYGAQKGASPSEIKFLDQGLRNLAKLVEDIMDLNLQEVSGAGAAGGFGGGAIAFLNGQLESGINMVKHLANFDEAIIGADWIITGEGQLDGQTLSGKTIDGVVQSAKQKSIPVAAFCGSVAINQNLQENLGISYATSIIKGICTLEEAMAASADNLTFASYNFAKLL